VINVLFDDKRHPSLLEMWALIESVGIKREQVQRAFSTEGDVVELYRLISKKIHYAREQEMIKRLHAYIQRLKVEELESIEQTNM
jgi:hypothetical protein